MSKFDFSKVAHDWFFVGLLAVVVVLQVMGFRKRSGFVSRDEFVSAVSELKALAGSSPSVVAAPSSGISASADMVQKEVRDLPSGVRFFRYGDVWCMTLDNVIFVEGDLSPFDGGRLETIRPFYVASSVCEYKQKQGVKYGS